jgi:hypothetical protein
MEAPTLKSILVTVKAKAKASRQTNFGSLSPLEVLDAAFNYHNETHDCFMAIPVERQNEPATIQVLAEARMAYDLYSLLCEAIVGE